MTLQSAIGNKPIFMQLVQEFKTVLGNETQRKHPNLMREAVDHIAMKIELINSSQPLVPLNEMELLLDVGTEDQRRSTV